MRRKKEKGLGEKNRGSGTGRSAWPCPGARWNLHLKCKEDSGVREGFGRGSEGIAAVIGGGHLGVCHGEQRVCLEK